MDPKKKICKKSTNIKEYPEEANAELHRVLDEKTGNFIFAESFETNNSFTPKKLDERTGLFIDANSNVESSSEDTFSIDSSSCFEVNSIESTSNRSSTPTKHKLDETSGLISHTRAKKGHSKRQQWKREKVKKARQQGECYYSLERISGEKVGMKQRSERKLKQRCRCKTDRGGNKCVSISDCQRAELFKSFWRDMSWDQRKSWISTLVHVVPVGRRRSQTIKRSCTLRYHLKVEGESIQVCKIMFLGTLNIGEWFVRNTLKNANDHGILKKTSNSRKTNLLNSRKIEHIKSFLDNIPKMPSHYCRQNSQKIYMELTYTSIKQVYKQFTNFLSINNISESERAGYKTFLNVTHELNIGLYKPKKDQCNICYAYKNKNVDTNTFNTHIRLKDRARKEKEQDKERARNGEINCFTLDVQAVQMVPFIAAGAHYFKQKLSCHQFTIFNLKNSEVVCYVWHEGEGGMDANIFASCLLHFLETEVTAKDIPICLFSDGCSAQNRNVTLSNALMYFSKKYNTTVYQKYLSVGHTQMECDSVHANIERRKKNKELFVPADFVKLIREARTTNGPYKVHYVGHTFFKKYSELNFYKSIRPGTKSGDACVTDVKCLKHTSVGVFYKLDYDDEWVQLPHRLKTEKALPEVKGLYIQPLKLPLRKFRDLQSFKAFIPTDYHAFYDNLSHEDI